jgi:hypothetical protein
VACHVRFLAFARQSFGRMSATAIAKATQIHFGNDKQKGKRQQAKGKRRRGKADASLTPLHSRCSEGLIVAGFGVGAGLAEDLAVAFEVAVEVDAFAALGAEDAAGFVAGHLAGMERDGDPLPGEEDVVGHLAVGKHLLGVLVLDAGKEFAGTVFGGLSGGDADGASAFNWGRQAEVRAGRAAEVDEAGGHFAPVAEFEGALAEAASGDDGDGVGGAAINLDEGNEALAVGRLRATRVVDAEQAAAEHSHANSEHLAGAEVSVGDLCVLE